MPRLSEVTTVESEKVWSSPDGQRTIYKLTLNYNGQEVVAKTYSDNIAQKGWTGEVEAYEKPGRKGSETFVRQVPKEQGSYPPRQESRQSGYGGGGSRTSSDNFTMYLSYAKDLAIACIKDGKFDSKLYGEVLDSVATGGTTLYEARPDAPKSEEKEVEEDFLKEIDRVFPEEDGAWKEPPQLPVS